MDSYLPDMIKDGRTCESKLVMAIQLKAGWPFPERLSVGLITAVYMSCDKSDVAI